MIIFAFNNCFLKQGLTIRRREVIENKEKARQPNILIDKQTKLMAIRQTKRRKYTL